MKWQVKHIFCESPNSSDDSDYRGRYQNEHVTRWWISPNCDNTSSDVWPEPWLLQRNPQNRICAETWENVPSTFWDNAHNKISYQPAHPRNLIRAFVVRMKQLCNLGYPKCAQQWRFWSDCANARRSFAKARFLTLQRLSLSSKCKTLVTVISNCATF